jgi:hypothetical protein
LTRLLKYSVLLLPLLFFWAGMNFHRAQYANDPEYIYLLNALAICEGNSVGTTDNPGITVMQISAVVITFTHWLSNPENDSLVHHVLKEPDQFVESIQNVLLFINSLALLLLGIVAFRKTGSVLVALLIQMTVFISTNTLEHLWTKVSPEPVLFFVTCIYVVAILFFYASKKKSNYKYPIVFALVTGFGLGTKATFLPLSIFPLFIFPGLKKKSIYLAGTALSFVLFTIPAIPEYRNMFFWFRNLIIHTGKYGQGEKGLIDLNTYLPNLFNILKNNPVFGATVAFGIIVLIYIIFQNSCKKEKRKTSAETRILTGLIATSVFAIILVAKHYHANHYLISVILLTGVTLFFSLNILLRATNALFFRNSVFAGLLIFLAFFLSWRQPPILKKADYHYKISNKEIKATNKMILKNFTDHTIIHYYTFSLNKFVALRFGNIYSKNRVLPSLKELYPETYFYDYQRNQFTNWEKKVTLKKIISSGGKKILMTGGPRNDKKVAEMAERGIPLKNIYKGRLQTIYELDTLKYHIPEKTHMKK